MGSITSVGAGNSCLSEPGMNLRDFAKCIDNSDPSGDAREYVILWVYCTACGREKDVDPASLALPGDTSVPTLGRCHLTCSACGSREIDTKPELYPGGIEAIRQAALAIERT